MIRTKVRLGRAGLVVVMVMLTWMVGGRSGLRYSSAELVAGRVHVVRQGESVWTIAERITGRRGDPRPVVDRIVAMNHIRGGVVQPGQQLRLP
jgi:hypothetical protein